MEQTGGNVPKAEDFETPYMADDWLQEKTSIVDPGDDHGDYYTNEKLLEAISQDIEYEYGM